MVHDASKPSEAVFVAAVLGTDGSGKSTLATALARELSITGRSCLIGDRLQSFEAGELFSRAPVETEELRRRLSARAKSAHSLDEYKLPKLSEILLRDQLIQDARAAYRPDAVVVDGMPALNLCAWSVLYREGGLDSAHCEKLLAILTHRHGVPDPREPIFGLFPELAQLRELGHDKLEMPNLVIMLDVPPPVCLERIEQRGEERQAHETEERLAALREAYLIVCDVLRREWGLDLLVLDGDREREQVAREAMEFVRKSMERSGHG